MKYLRITIPIVITMMPLHHCWENFNIINNLKGHCLKRAT